MIVFVHGFSGSSQLFQEFGEYFIARNHCVLTYDLIGHGFSTGPDLDYNLEVFVEQLFELVTNVFAKENIPQKKFTLVGSSMGGAISAAFASRYPEFVKELVLLSPAGFPVNKPAIAKLIHIPILSDYLYPIVGPKLLCDLVDHEFNGEHERHLVEKVRKIKHYQCTNNPSYLPVLLSILRNFPLDSMGDTFKKIGELNLPVLLVMGDRDRAVPLTNTKLFLDVMKQAKLLQLNETGHYCFLQRVDVLQPAIHHFIQHQSLPDQS
jgi:pimeloyl-ACP methyl ester carboxylesterase